MWGHYCNMLLIIIPLNSNMIFSFILLFLATKWTNRNQFFYFWTHFIKCFDRDEYHDELYLTDEPPGVPREVTSAWQTVKHAHSCNLSIISKLQNWIVDLQSKLIEGQMVNFTKQTKILILFETLLANEAM